MEVEKSLLLMSKLNTEQTLERILTHLKYDEESAGERLNKFNEQIAEFKLKTKRVFTLLEKMKAFAVGLETVRKHQIHQMSKLTEHFSNYEEFTLGAYAVSEFSKNLLFADPNKGDIKDTMNSLSRK
jgi:hypothetical protein